MATVSHPSSSSSPPVIAFAQSVASGVSGLTAGTVCHVRRVQALTRKGEQS